jgi:hypothetical protein
MTQPSEAEPMRILSDDAMTRILMHGMHEETMFYNRINFFMLMEALLFSSLVSANGLSAQNSNLTMICSSVGILVSLIWLVVQRAKARRVKYLGERLLRDVPDFAESIAFGKKYGIELPATEIIAWFPPTACGVAWLTLLLWRWLMPLFR